MGGRSNADQLDRILTDRYLVSDPIVAKLRIDGEGILSAKRLFT